MQLSPKEIKNFWKKVHKTESCWLWIGGKFDSGYGLYKVQSLTMRAHRVSWMVNVGPIPQGMCVCHDCPGGDNPLCVRPDHLWIGTSPENTKDKMNKGRHRYQFGENHYAAKLSDQDVVNIRSRLGTRRGIQASIAREYGVSTSLISAIANGQRRVPPPQKVIEV